MHSRRTPSTHDEYQGAKRRSSVFLMSHRYRIASHKAFRLRPDPAHDNKKLITPPNDRVTHMLPPAKSWSAGIAPLLASSLGRSLPHGTADVGVRPRDSIGASGTLCRREPCAPPRKLADKLFETGTQCYYKRRLELFPQRAILMHCDAMRPDVTKLSRPDGTPQSRTHLARHSKRIVNAPRDFERCPRQRGRSLYL